MRIAILHYHLHPGGVTRIIQMQLEALRQQKDIEKIQIFSGDLNSAFDIPDDVEIIYDECLNYLNCAELSKDEIKRKYNRIIALFLEECSADTIIHAHNMNLGKNPVLTAALNALMKSGRNIVNHIHDFAEDRPANMEALSRVIEKHFNRSLMELLYPVCENCHYAVLNSMYVKRLTKLGIPEERVCLLPNPVEVQTIQAGKDKEKAKVKVFEVLKLKKELPAYVYPVRGIRRKNIGEFILLASLFKDKANWIITLPPKNPVEKVEYDKWKEFCVTENIPLIFEAGEKCKFNEIMAAANRCITTSIREGFGMFFLESWLFGLPIVGRNLPVTQDFLEVGVKFEGLYDHIYLSGMTDFGSLTQAEQMEWIKLLTPNTQPRENLLEENPHLKEIFRNFPDSYIQANINLIKQYYSIENYGKTLLTIYKLFI